MPERVDVLSSKGDAAVGRRAQPGSRFGSAQPDALVARGWRISGYALRATPTYGAVVWRL